MPYNKQPSKLTLMIIGGTVLLALILLLFGCDYNPPEFYSVDKECLLVQQEDHSHNCYENHVAYAYHEGLHIEHAKEKFNAFMLESRKREKMKQSLDSNQVKKLPSMSKHKEDYIEKSLTKETN